MDFHDPERHVFTCYELVSFGLLERDEVETGELAPLDGETV
jgi:hypothetical protein